MVKSDYVKTRMKYPTKPQFFWELGADGGQTYWIDKALQSIMTDYPAVKGVMFDVHTGPNYDPQHEETTKKVIKSHFSSGYFLGRVPS